MNKKVLVRASFVTAVTIILSLVMTYSVLIFFHGKIEPLALISASIIPLVVAFPTAVWMGMQETKLEIANLELKNTCVELDKLRNQAELQAQLDPMTGLHNRNYFFDTVQKKLKNNVQGALIMLDVDHFKSVNDQYGHAAGDNALISIVAALNAVLCKDDIIGRVGGEEFALFLPDINKTRAEDISRKLSEAVNNIRFQPTANHQVKLTISIGGSMSVPSVTFEELMHRADKHMYRAKNLGRNCVVFENQNNTDCKSMISANAA